ncbi:MAG: VCBS repeat-containing protein [Acidobacteriota bacterium]
MNKVTFTNILALAVAGAIAHANPVPWVVVAEPPGGGGGGGGCAQGNGCHEEEYFVGHGLSGISPATSFRRAARTVEAVKKVVSAPGEGLVYMEERRIFSIHPMLGTLLHELVPTTAQIPGKMVDIQAACAGEYVVLDDRGGLYRVNLQDVSVSSMFAGGWTARATSLTMACPSPMAYVVAENTQGEPQIFRIVDGVVVPVGTPLDRMAVTVKITDDGRYIFVVYNNGDIEIVDPVSGVRQAAPVRITVTTSLAGAEVILDGQDVYVRALETSGRLWQADMTRGTLTELANETSLANGIAIATVALPLPKAGIILAMSPDRDNGAIAEVKFRDGVGQGFPNLPDFRPEGGTIDKSGLNGVIANFGLEPWLEIVEGLALAKYDPSFNDYGDQDVIFYSLVMKDSKGDPLALQRLRAYSARGGVNIAAMHPVANDNHAWLVTGPGPGPNYAPQVNLYSLDSTTRQFKREISWYAYGTLRYGANVAAGDLDGDGVDEVITGAGPGAVFGPHVRAFRFDKTTRKLTTVPGASFFAYGTPKFGVNVSAADIDGDGKDEIVTGAGPGQPFSEHVRAFTLNGIAMVPTSVNYVVNTYTFGACIGAADMTRDGKADLIAGPGPADLPGVVTVIDHADQATGQFAAFPNNLLEGVRVYAAVVAEDIVP